MESTGVFWKSVQRALAAAGVDVWVVNARTCQGPPGSAASFPPASLSVSPSTPRPVRRQRAIRRYGPRVPRPARCRLSET